MTGRVLLAVGAALAGPQLLMDRPWQAAFAFGLVLMLAGAVLIFDAVEQEL